MAIVKAKRGRPLKFTPDELTTIYDAFNDYIKDTADPTIVGFISTFEINGKWIDRSYLQSKKQFTALIIKARAKEETYLLNQMKNPAMAIFRLKQPLFGYTDKKEVESHSLNVNIEADPQLAHNFVAYLKQHTKT